MNLTRIKIFPLSLDFVHTPLFSQAEDIIYTLNIQYKYTIKIHKIF